MIRRYVRQWLEKSGYTVIHRSMLDCWVENQIDRKKLRPFASGLSRWWSLTATEYELLRELVEEANAYPGDIVEVGTLLGRTASKLALWKSPEKRILTVDNYAHNPWGLTHEVHFELASLVLSFLAASEHVTQIRANKEDWYGQYSGPPPALVFLDADHSYEATKSDIEWAKSVGTVIVCGHDYSKEHPGVIRAVDESGGPARLAGSVWSLAAYRSTHLT